MSVLFSARATMLLDTFRLFRLFPRFLDFLQFTPVARIWCARRVCALARANVLLSALRPYIYAKSAAQCHKWIGTAERQAVYVQLRCSANRKRTSIYICWTFELSLFHVPLKTVHVGELLIALVFNSAVSLMDYIQKNSCTNLYPSVCFILFH